MATCVRRFSVALDMRRVAVTFAAIVSVDQLSKALVPANVDGTSGGMIVNNGAIGGVIPLEGPPLLILTFAALVAFWLFGWPLVARGVVHPVIPGVLAGGAAGNIIDRVLLGYVRDFIWTPWLVVNVADLALAVGVLLFLTNVVVTQFGRQARLAHRVRQSDASR